MTRFYQIIFFNFLIILTFSSPALYGQQLAFPGAEGFGRFTSGGRGGTVYIVTSLEDSGPGSLRAGLEMSGARTIVFAVSGTIYLENEIRIRNGDLTIAGQTAPGDGIALAGNGLVVDADNIIIRYLRIRPGNISGRELDAIWGREQKNIIIDHCSFSWATDEVASFYDNENFTMQWCIISESLYESVHTKGRHGYGGIWGGVGATFHHNLLAHHSSRNPRFNGARYTTTPETELVDHRNNVIFNWGGNSAYGGEGGNHNIVANYYKPGPATSGEKEYRIVEPYGSSDVPLGRWYVADNYVEGYPEVTASNRDGGIQNLSEEELALALVDEPFSYAPVETQDAQEAYQLVLAGAGASYPGRDRVDQRIAEEAKTGEVSLGGAYGAGKGIIDTQETAGGWPVLFSAPAPEDSDQDGMPDEWELANALDPDDAADRNSDPDGDGYTSLEEYLNGILGTEPGAFLKHPSMVAVQEVSSASVRLGWEDNTERETGFIIERSRDGNEFEVIATLPANTTTFLDEELGPGLVYLYRLQAVNETETSAYSLVVSAKTLPEPLAANPAGLVGYWGFDAVDGTNMEDKSAYGNDGQVMEVESPEWISGKVNNAVDLSAAPATAHILIPDEVQLNFGKKSFSVSFWMKASAQEGEAFLFQKGSLTQEAGTGGKGYGLFIKDGMIRFVIDDNIVKSEVSTRSLPFLTGDWEHVVVVRDTENKVLQIYLNGVLLNEAKDNTLYSLSTAESFIIGNSKGLTAPYQGALDEFKVYNYALNETEAGGLFSGIVQKVSQPSPGSGTTGVNPDEVPFSWAGDAVAYDVYMGTTADHVELLAEGLTKPSYTASGLVTSADYFWRVDATGGGGNTVAGEVWSFKTGEVTGLKEQAPEMSGFSCTPNPVTDYLTIRFSLHQREEVFLALYDLQNRLISTIKQEVFLPGDHEVQLSIQHDLRQSLRAGVYFCVLQSPRAKLAKRVIYLKK